MRFLHVESAGGMVLLACTVVALAPGQLPSRSRLRVAASDRGRRQQSAISRYPSRCFLWINDGLMALFFFVVGLEIKREIVSGELSDPRKALLPVVAAVGGMVVPAALYALGVWGGPGAHGWGVPMATDIAFVVGFLTLLGPRVPNGLKVLLLTLAIADDIGAVLVIAVVYSTRHQPLAPRPGRRRARPDRPAAVARRPQPGGLRGAGGGGLAGVLRVARPPDRGRRPARPADPGSARHGPAGGARRGRRPVRPAARHPARHPARGRRTRSPPRSGWRTRCTPGWPSSSCRCSPWPTPASASQLGTLATPVALAVIAGLVVGKPLGIVLFSWASVRLRLTRLPEGMSWKVMVGAGCLGGIGFTMSLFIAGLAFPEAALLDEAKVGVLAGSALSAVLGCGLLLAFLPPPSQS